jgi:hypothetical protein
MCEGRDPCRGFSGNWQDTYLDLKKRGFLRGLSGKRLLLPPLDRTELQSRGALRRWALAAAVPAIRARGAGAGGGKRRGVHGKLEGALTDGEDGEESLNFGDGRESQPAGLVPDGGLHRWPSGDGKEVAASSPALWNSPRRRPAPGTPHAAA